MVMTSFVKILPQLQGFDVDESEYMAQINAAKLLIIDDLGAERSTDYALEKVYNVIRQPVQDREAADPDYEPEFKGYAADTGYPVSAYI